MTNAEAFIGDEDLIDTFIDEFNEFACKQDWDLEHHCLKEKLKEFFKQERTPTLTEDERVILNHINVYEFDKIGRANNGNLYLHYKDDKDTEDFWWCDHLFQFIKERRRIRDKGVIR